MTEEELIRGCMENSRVAQKQLFNEYYAEMLSLCKLYCVNHDDAESVVNHGFMDVFVNIGKFKNQSSLRTWIRRIMTNKSIDFYNKEKLKLSRQLSIDNERQIVINAEDFNENILNKLQYQDLQKLIHSLPDNERNVFVMFVIEGYSHKEIAESLNIVEGTCRWYMNNARKLLKEKLKKNEQFEQQKQQV